MAMEEVRKHEAYELPLHELYSLSPNILWSKPPTISPGLSPIEVCHIVGEWYVAHTSEERRHATGQFFTPPIVACYMANLAGRLHNKVRVLEPGAGVGILACAICEVALQQRLPEISVTI